MQLHCPPTAVYSDDGVFDALDTLVAGGPDGRVRRERGDLRQALTAIARPDVATVQIILNAFRLKPLERVLPAAAEAGVGIIARVPLASGLLSGRYDRDTRFGADDHRNYNRHGESFDVGETFSGVDFATGLAAVERLTPLVPRGRDDGAVRAALDHRPARRQRGHPRRPQRRQARANAAAAGLPPLAEATRGAVAAVYDELIRPQVHDRW